MPLKVRPSGAERVPTSSAPAGFWWRSRQRKTALRRECRRSVYFDGWHPNYSGGRMA